MTELKRYAVASMPILCPVCDSAVRFTVSEWPTTRCPECRQRLGIKIPLRNRVILILLAIGAGFAIYRAQLTPVVLVATVTPTIALFFVAPIVVFHRAGYLVVIREWVFLSESETRRLRAERQAIDDPPTVATLDQGSC